MADVTISYKGATIATMDDSGTKTLGTSGKYCEGDIGVEYVKPSGGEQVYVSSTGLLYTPVMTIDVGMEQNNGYLISDALTRYGTMPYLEELTLIGIMRNNATSSLIQINQFLSENFPALKKIHIQPTSVRSGNGSEYESTDTKYNNFAAAHYAFSTTNLTELTLGKLGGPYWRGGGYYRNDMPMPPGTNSTQVGSEDGLLLKIYVASYMSPAAGFMSYLAPNTTVIQYDYLTGEVLTA